MADRADLSVVRRMIYENLAITGQTAGYGSLDTDNKRYPSNYIEDAIAHADLQVLTTLLRSKQYNFDNTFYTIQPIDSWGEKYLPTNCELLNVFFFSNNSGGEIRGQEISWDMFRALFPLSGNDVLFPNIDNDYTPSAEGLNKYGGYYCVKDHMLYTIPFLGVSYQDSVGYYRYIAFTHPDTLPLASLQSPEGFEDAVALFASAQLLMKRADNPEQAGFYMQQYQSLMGLYMTPSNNTDRTTDR